MKALVFCTLFLTLFSFHQSHADSYPTSPDLQMTPGALCQSATRFRYPEKIAYCERNVDSETKKQIIQDYDRRFGYRIQQMPRSQFKIDHFIPLCMGGSNTIDNLWPQHQSVFEITDPLEPVLCGKMAEGKLLQKDAVKLIVEAKTHLDEVPAILKKVEAL
jgi:hypothetical protein